MGTKMKRLTTLLLVVLQVANGSELNSNQINDDTPLDKNTLKQNLLDSEKETSVALNSQNHNVQNPNQNIQNPNMDALNVAQNEIILNPDQGKKKGCCAKCCKKGCCAKCCSSCLDCFDKCAENIFNKTVGCYKSCSRSCQSTSLIPKILFSPIWGPIYLLKTLLKFNYAPIDNVYDLFESILNWCYLNFTMDFLGEIIHKVSYNKIEVRNNLEMWQNVQMMQFLYLTILALIFFYPATAAQLKKKGFNPRKFVDNFKTSPLGKFLEWSTEGILKLGKRIHSKKTFGSLLAWFTTYTFLHFLATWGLLALYGRFPTDARSKNIPASCDVTGTRPVQNLACIFLLAKWGLGGWVFPLVADHLSTFSFATQSGETTLLAISSFVLLLLAALLQLFYIKVIKLAGVQLGTVTASPQSIIFQKCKCLRVYLSMFDYTSPNMTALDAPTQEHDKIFDEDVAAKYDQMTNSLKCLKNCNKGWLNCCAYSTVLAPAITVAVSLFFWYMTASISLKDVAYDLMLIFGLVPTAMVMNMLSRVAYRKSVYDLPHKFDPNEWREDNYYQHFKDVFFNWHYGLQFITSSIHFGVFVFYAWSMISKVISFFTTSPYAPTGNEFGESFSSNGENVIKSIELLRVFDWVTSTLGTGLAFIFLGMIKVYGSHASERKYFEFTLNPTELDYRHQFIKNWEEGHLEAFMKSKKHGISHFYCKDIEKHIRGNKLDGNKLLEIAKTRRTINFYALFAELENPPTFKKHNPISTRYLSRENDLKELGPWKENLHNLLRNLKLTCSDDDKLKEHVETMYDNIGKIQPGDLYDSLDKVILNAKNNLMVPYMEQHSEDKITVSLKEMNDYRSLKAAKEYYFDNEHDKQLYQGYELLESKDGTVHGPGEYKWVKHQKKDVPQKDGSRKTSSRCGGNCEDKLYTSSDEEQDFDPQISFGVCTACGTHAYLSSVKRFLEDKVKKNEPLHIHKVKKFDDGKLWGQMREKMDVPHATKGNSLQINDLVSTDVWFWIPISGENTTYLEPNYERVHNVQFPWAEEGKKMKHLDFTTPEPAMHEKDHKRSLWIMDELVKCIFAFQKSENDPLQNLINHVNHGKDEENVKPKNKI